MKGKKLPKRIWIVADSLGWYACAIKPRPAINTVIRNYTPAKPAKVCRWRRDEDSTFSTGCDRLGLNIHGLYCQKCGGKIKVAR